MKLRLLTAAMLIAVAAFVAVRFAGTPSVGSTESPLVPEDRSASGGRQIPINFVVLRGEAPASSVRHALFLLAGGPGEGSTAMSGMADGWMRPLRASMDIVLMDQRGTGASNPLACETDIDANLAHAFGHVFDPAEVERCRAGLSDRADLTMYTTDAAVADLEALRIRLGYDQVSLYGGSYGTRLAQAYLRRHPDRTRAVVLDGVLPFDVGGPLTFARSLQRSIDLLIAANPRLSASLSLILVRFDEGPVRGTVRAPSGAPIVITMTRGDFMYAIRGILYSAAAVADLPPMITRAASTGDLSEFAQRYWQRASRLSRSLARGLHLSVLCAEDIGFATDADVASASAGTLMGTYLIEEYRRACALWPKAEIASDFRTPVAARVPVLLVSGHFDPVTPPEFGDRVAASLPLARHIVAPTGSHGSASGCAKAAVLHVLSTGSLDGIPDVCR